MGGKVTTRLRIVNHTTVDIVDIKLSMIDNYDWGSDRRPDHNFRGASIPAGSYKEEYEDVNKLASNCPFNMDLIFRDGTKDSFRINQKHAVDMASPGFSHYHKNHDLNYSRVDGEVLRLLVTHTHQQLNNNIARQLSKEATALVSRKEYSEALGKLDQAEHMANEKATIDEVKSNKVNALSSWGESLLNQALGAELDQRQDRSQEAKNKFAEAKSKYEQAGVEEPSSYFRTKIQMVDAKIKANETFNKANDLEQEAYNLFQQALVRNSTEGYGRAQAKYAQAMEKYKEAENEFDTASKVDSRLISGLKITRASIDGVEQALSDIETLKFKNNVAKVNFNESVTEDNSLKNQHQYEFEIGLKNPNEESAK